MTTQSLDSDLLRTFLAIAEAGSVTGGAARIRRSQSATSLQLKQLEEIVGAAVFHRHGRGISLTSRGERLLHVALDVRGKLDAIQTDLREEGLSGSVRIGFPDDHDRVTLSRIVAGFASAHPRVEVEVRCGLGTGIAGALDKGALDMAVHEVAVVSPSARVLRSEQLVWMVAPDSDVASRDPLPVAVFDRDCWWRELALSSLMDLGRRYRVAFTSESTAGVGSAVLSGVAVGLLGVSSNADGLVPVAGMGEGHPSHLVLETARHAEGPICQAMQDAIVSAYESSPVAA
jgi:DNA-binding transcriptional LysR family regulator